MKMRNLAVLLFMLMSVNVMAQKIESKKEDPFEGINIITTSIEKLSKETFKDTKGQTMFYFESQGPKIYLHLLWQCRDIYFIPQGETAFLLLDDKTKIELKAAHDVKPVAGIASTKAVKPAGVWGMDIPYYSLEMDKLEGRKVTDIRIKTTDGYYDFVVQPKNQGLISACLSLIKSEMNK